MTAVTAAGFASPCSRRASPAGRGVAVPSGSFGVQSWGELRRPTLSPRMRPGCELHQLIPKPKRISSPRDHTTLCPPFPVTSHRQRSFAVLPEPAPRMFTLPAMTLKASRALASPSTLRCLEPLTQAAVSLIQSIVTVALTVSLRKSSQTAPVFPRLGLHLG